MYQVKIEDTVEVLNKIIIGVGEQMVDENGDPMERQAETEMEVQDTDNFGNLKVDENGNPVMVNIKIAAFDENGDPIMEPVMNDKNTEQVIPFEKTAEELATERQALIDAKTAEIQAELDAYMAAQEYQRQNGGSGPVAREEIMKICNEHNCEFEVIFREE